MNRLLRLTALVAVAWAWPAAAWDSICYQYQDATSDVSKLVHKSGTRNCEGLEAARGRWRDPEHHVDEHRLIFEAAAKRAGLPDGALETMRLRVLTGPSSQVVRGAGGDLPTVTPVSIGTASRAVVRAFSLDEFAQLPDFSYALSDWARGNETCPFELPTPFNQPQACHVFKTHMGAVNSSHFPPQSDQWFDHYHKLALDRAAACHTTRAAVWAATPEARRTSTDARFAPSWRECEVEALAYEAIAQHYLQDSWSAGHMWERWGSTDLAAFPGDIQANGSSDEDAKWNSARPVERQLMVAEMVGVMAGTIHGSDPAVVEAGYWGRPSLHDPLGYPHPNVAIPNGDALLNVVGDLHLHDVIGGLPLHSDVSSTPLPYVSAVLQGQADKLLNCSTRSLGAVYAELGDTLQFGPPALGASTAVTPPFDREACLAPMVTNLAFSAGVDSTNIQFNVGVGKASIQKIPGSVQTLARNDYARLRTAADILAKVRPRGTEMARLHLTETVSYEEHQCADVKNCPKVTFTAKPRLFTMLGVKPNRCYAAGGGPGCGTEARAMPAFIDPALTPPLAPPNPSQPAGALALAFHASRAPQLCNTLTASELAALPSMVSSAAPGVEHANACEACAEYVVPFLRLGTDADHYDTSVEPLCKYTAADPAAVPYLYEPALGTTNPTTLARRYCGCSGLVAATNTGVQRLDVSTSGGKLLLTPVGARVPVGSIPRDVAVASGGRILVSNGSGELVGVRDDAEVDLDGNGSNGITRLSFPGITDLPGLAVANLGGRELVLAAASGTGELVAHDLGAHSLCGRVQLGRTSGEGAYDVVVTADGTKVFVSLRKTSPLSGAIAVVDANALARCDGTAAATVRYITPPGATVGLGPMALSPSGGMLGTQLAVGGRYASTCLDQIKTGSGAMQDVQVGCDRVFVMDVATETFRAYGTATGLPTRPGRYPYSLAWFKDGVRLAYAAFQGVNFGFSDSGWPAAAGLRPLPLGGTLRLADTNAATFEGGGADTSRHWTYNMPLDSNVIGETVVTDDNWVFVGTANGRVSAYAVTPVTGFTDPMWEGSPADPETPLHTSTNGAWYGGCSHPCSSGLVCPDVCPSGIVPAGFTSVELGSSVRVLSRY